MLLNPAFTLLLHNWADTLSVLVEEVIFNTAVSGHRSALMGS